MGRGDRQDRRRARPDSGHHRLGDVVDPRCGRRHRRPGRSRQHHRAGRHRRRRSRRRHARALGRCAARRRDARPDLRRRPSPGLRSRRPRRRSRCPGRGSRRSRRRGRRVGGAARAAEPMRRGGRTPAPSALEGNGVSNADTGGDPVDLVSGRMVARRRIWNCPACCRSCCAAPTPRATAPDACSVPAGPRPSTSGCRSTPRASTSPATTVRRCTTPFPAGDEEVLPSRARAGRSSGTAPPTRSASPILAAA